MAGIFDTMTLNGMPLSNRLVRSATWEGMCAKEGRPTEKLITFYRDLARGGVGLIITGYAFVSPEGKQLPGKMGIHCDQFSSEMRAMTDAVHKEGGRICVQLVHAGGQTDSRNAGQTPLAPSAVECAQFSEIPQAMDGEEIRRVVAAFGAAARRAREYGFDAVQLHGAHGYLINQFLSPLTNLRTDAYGGDIENRSRFLMEVYDAVRAAVGSGYPVLIKLNGDDHLGGGFSIDDALVVARKLDLAGIDAIEISGGTPASGDRSPARQKISRPEKEAYHLDLARRMREATGVPLASVGGFRSFEVADRAVREGVVDLVSMARPLIREPDLPKRWQVGDRTPAKCISCNECFMPGLKEGGIYCVVEKKQQDRGSGKTS